MLCHIEAFLNSRPISALSNTTDDFNYLTPGHILVGTPLLSLPDKTVIHPNKNLVTRWKLVQRVTDEFWKRWSVEYPQGLQHRYKWNKIQKNIRSNDMLLVSDSDNFKTKWILGRVVDCHPGEDNLVRVVSVKTTKGTYRRPISKLCLLPVCLENQE